jgi:hypothetical protein
MADPNKIRIYPIDPNVIVLDSVNVIELESDPFRPDGHVLDPGVTPIGGSDIKKKISASGGSSATVGGSNVKADLSNPQRTSG